MAFFLAAGLGCASDISSDRHPGASNADQPGWTLAPEPELLLSGGRFNGDSIHLYRIAGAVFGAQRDIVVAVGGGDNRIVFFTDSGRIVRVAGRRGKGPGEFAAMSGLYPSGEDVAVWDGTSARISFLSNRDDAVRGVRVQTSPMDRVVGVLDDGTLVTTASSLYSEEGEQRTYDLWTRDGAAAGRLIGPMESANGHIRIPYVHGGGRRATVTTSLAPECLPRVLHGVLGNRVFVAEPSKGVVIALSRSSDAEVIHRAVTRDTVTLAMVDSVRQEIERVVAHVRQPMSGPDGLRVLSDVRFPAGAVDSVVEMLGDPGEPVPTVWSVMVTDRSGHVWLRRSNCGSTRMNDTWDVLDTVGKRVATALTRAGLRLWFIDGDRVLAGVTDSIGVEHIAVLRVAR